MSAVDLTLVVIAHDETAVCGLAGGAIVSLWAVGYLESQLYGVRAYDPAVWAAVAATLITVAIVGGVAPAARAARVDPVVALRVE